MPAVSGHLGLSGAVVGTWHLDCTRHGMKPSKVVTKRWWLAAAVCLSAFAACSDHGPSLPADSGFPISDTGAAIHDSGNDAEADAPGDAPTDAPGDAPTDATPDGADGGIVCAAPSQVAYATPGCGTAAPAPYCQSPTDACASIDCGCDGADHAGGCGFSLIPYRHAGTCADGAADASDAKSEAEAGNGPADSAVE